MRAMGCCDKKRGLMLNLQTLKQTRAASFITYRHVSLSQVPLVGPGKVWCFKVVACREGLRRFFHFIGAGFKAIRPVCAGLNLVLPPQSYSGAMF
jgi:hypothetical protein